MKPRLVVIEGLDGTGKTSCAKDLADQLNWRYMTTPNPVLRKYRGDILASFKGNQEAAHLFYLASVFDAAKEIEQLLSSGESIVLDRYFLSTVAYAEFRGSSLDLDCLGTSIPPADMTCFLDAPREVRLRRTEERGQSQEDMETFAHDADQKLKYLHTSRQDAVYVGKWRKIDATGPQSSVVERIRGALRELGH